jgi:hypothetical protein
MSQGIEQRLMFVLTVNLDETLREVAEDRGSCEIAVHERPAPA